MLPLLEKGTEAHAPERPERPAPAGEEALVLVVDDDTDVLAFTRLCLEREGFAVVTATTAHDGASMAARRRPDVILLDLLLPDRSGLDLLKSLKADPATASIPVLVVSITHDSVKALSLGAAECLSKPVSAETVVGTVRRLLEDNHGEATVLVVDDETDTVDFIRDTLKGEGFRVLVAHDGRQALEALRRRTPDLVLLDLMMPELSGFEVLEALARDPKTSGIPVAVLTARGGDGDQQRGLALGARRYMNKPFDVRDLIAEVQRQVGARSGEEKGGRAAL
jgi:DNA-binding response OmpR family regulator